MNPLRQELHDRLVRMMVDRHVTPLPGRAAPRPDPAPDPAAIVSGLPDVRIDSGRGAFSGRKKRLRIEDGSSGAEFLARHRPPPAEPGGPWLMVRWATDRRGQRIPICCVDRETRTIHMLLELDSLVSRDASPDPGAARALSTVLFEEPVDALLEEAGEVRVGPDVARRVASLLKARPSVWRRLIIEELAFLGAITPVPGGSRLARRAEQLRRALRGSGEIVPPKAAGPRDVEAEIRRLRLLVESRACAELRFEDLHISGLMNPRPLRRGFALAPSRFRLSLGESRREPALKIFEPADRDATRGRGMCLGRAIPVLLEVQRASDLYGIVDVVLNFTETNRIGAVPLEGRRRTTVERWMASWLSGPIFVPAQGGARP